MAIRAMRFLEARWAIQSTLTMSREAAMREDMSKVLVESPRLGRAGARALEGSRRQASRNGSCCSGPPGQRGLLVDVGVRVTGPAARALAAKRPARTSPAATVFIRCMWWFLPV